MINTRLLINLHEFMRFLPLTKAIEMRVNEFDDFISRKTKIIEVEGKACGWFHLFSCSTIGNQGKVCKVKVAQWRFRVSRINFYAAH